MKRVFWTILWILTATVIASAQTTFYYPHVVNGVLGSFILKTTILLTNPASSGTASGTIAFTGDTNNVNLGLAGTAVSLTVIDETGASTTGSTIPFSIPAGGTHKLVSNGAGPYKVGFATVSTTTGTVNGTAIFSEFDPAGNLIGEAGVPAASASLRQAIFVDTQGGYNIGVAYANPGSAAASVQLTLLNSSALMVVSTTQILGTGNHVSRFSSEFFVGSTLPEVAGTMQSVSDSPLAAIALRFDPTLSKFTTLPPVTLASLINPAIEWLQERPWLAPLSSVARLLGGLQFRIG